MTLDDLQSLLPGLHGLLDRLSGLPADLGELALSPLKDVSCLSALLSTTSADERFALIARAHREPEWTLAALGAAEWLVAMDLPAAEQDRARAEYGRLLVRTGEVDAGRAMVERCRQHPLAEWVLIDAVRHFPDPLARQRFLDEQFSNPRDLAIRQAVSVERWWLALIAQPQAAVSVRYEVENYLAENPPSEVTPERSDALRGRALHCLGHALALVSNSPLLDMASLRLTEAIALYRKGGDPAALARGLDMFGRVLTRRGQHDEATRAFAESLQLKLHLRDVRGLGATLHGMAHQRLARGRPLEAAGLLQANLILLPLLEASPDLVRQKQEQLVLALLTAAFPLSGNEPDILPRLRTAILEYRESVQVNPEATLARSFSAAQHWLEARQIPEANNRRSRLQQAIRLLQGCLRDFPARSEERARFAMLLALALMDRAEVAAINESASLFLDQAVEVLRRADNGPVEQTIRPYLEWTFARWAGAARRFDDRQTHLASARYWAELTGNVQFQGVVDDSLTARLIGPINSVTLPLIVRPGTSLTIPLLLSDRRDRPLPRFGISPCIVGDNPPFWTDTSELRTDESGRIRIEVEASPDREGRADLEIRTRAGRLLASVPIEVRDLRIDGWQSSEEDEFVLRQLFGAGYQRLLVRRAFSGGLSGAQVLLVHPRMRPPEGVGPAWQAQPCIVKIGDAAPLASEWEHYQRWVQDLLPANVTRVTRFVAWENRAAIQMSLVGTGWSRSRSEHEWILDASPFDVHYLLEQIFHRDLGVAWYANTGSDRPSGPLLEAYAPTLPPVWTIKDTNPPCGLLAEAPDRLPRLDLRTGLQPRPSSPLETVAVAGLTLNEVRPTGLAWEYEMVAPTGLRVIFRTPLRPEQVDSEGLGTRLREPGRVWSIQGRAVVSLADRLRRNLRSCCDFWNRTTTEGLVYDADAGVLRLPVGGTTLSLPDPVAWVDRLFLREATWHASLIHGDLHGQNVLVNAQGQPYYIDFAKTRPGPTLYDFIKHEQYLWHDVFARLVEVDLATVFAWLFPLLGRLRREHHHLHRTAEEGPSGAFPDWLATFEQGLHTLRVLGRAYCRAAGEVDFHAPFAGLATVMLRWCGIDPAEPPAEQRIRARQGLLQAALAAWTVQHAVSDK